MKEVIVIIDVSNPETYPKELEEYVISAFDSLSNDIVQKIKSYPKELYESSIRCAIEDYYRPKDDEFYKRIIDILNNHEVIFYHGTKVLDESQILLDGLRTNDWNRYQQLLVSTYNQLEIDGDYLDEIMNHVEHEYNRKYFSPREPQLCFFSSLSLVDSGESAGYEQFCENVGGEIAKWALKEKYPDMYKPLHKNGKSYIVKFFMRFADIDWYRKDSIAYEFISYYAGRYFFNYSYQIEFDGTTAIDIPKENIIELISYDREIDY